MAFQLTHPARRTSTPFSGKALVSVVSNIDSSISFLPLFLLLLVVIRLLWAPALCSSLEPTYAGFDAADEIRAEDRDGWATLSSFRFLVGRLTAALVSPNSTSL